MVNKKLYYKYAELLLVKGLCIKKKQPLVINAPVEVIDFIRVLTEVAMNMGVNDIYYDWYDDDLKHTVLKNIRETDIKKIAFWNKSTHDKYAKKGAAFLFLIASDYQVMYDINACKLKNAAMTSIKTRKLYRDMQSNNQVSWCIASVATLGWSKLLFPKSKQPRDELWKLIFDICYINEKDPLAVWNKKIDLNKQICKKLNNLKIKSLSYKNSLGTNLEITLTDKAIWCGGASMINNQELLVNIPTEEVFTTPNKFLTSGIVYASMPLIHSGISIENIKLVFKDGKVIDYDASKGLSELKNIIETDDEAKMLGEVALVDKNSKIALSGVMFYETLFDENAACHIALGRGFKECFTNGEELDVDELETLGYNKSSNHVDIMIGTKDLMITAKTYDNKEIIIFKDGSFNI